MWIKKKWKNRDHINYDENYKRTNFRDEMNIMNLNQISIRDLNNS